MRSTLKKAVEKYALEIPRLNYLKALLPSAMAKRLISLSMGIYEARFLRQGNTYFNPNRNTFIVWYNL